MARALQAISGGGRPSAGGAAEVKAMMLEALDRAGGVDYLAGLAESDPKLFLHMLEKVLPMQAGGEDDGGGDLRLSETINEGRERARS